MPPESSSNFHVEVDQESGSVTVTLHLTKEEAEDRIMKFKKEDQQEIGKIWWCVKCSSGGPSKSVQAYTEIDAGFGTCGLQPFGVSRGKCDE